MKSHLLDIMAELPLNQKSEVQRFNGHLIFKGIYMPSLSQTPTDFQIYSICILAKILKGKISLVQISYLQKGYTIHEEASSNACLTVISFHFFTTRSSLKPLQCSSMVLGSQAGLTRKSKTTSERQQCSANRNSPKSRVFCSQTPHTNLQFPQTAGHG